MKGLTQAIGSQITYLGSDFLNIAYDSISAVGSGFSEAFTSMGLTGLAGFTKVTPVARSSEEEFVFASEDLDDLWSSSANAPDAPESISRSIYETAAEMLHVSREMGIAPEINGLDNGVVQLLWTSGGSFVAAEIGNDSYGLISFAYGRTVYKRNGAIWELQSQLVDRIRVLLEGEPAEVPFLEMDTFIAFESKRSTSLSKISVPGLRVA